MIEIYTDASVSFKHGIATATCFAISPQSFIGYQVFSYDDCNNTALAEIMGAADGLEYTSTVTDLENKKVVLFSDFPALFSISKKDLNTTTTMNDRMKSQVARLQKLIKRYNVRIEYIAGHQKKMNPNKVVDFISNSTLRYKIRGV